MYDRKLIGLLREWKEKKDRKPLILRGARQVGKTTLVNMFSKEFDFFIPLNLELPDHYQIFEDQEKVETIVQILYLKYKIIPKEHASILLFIDEIQYSGKAIKMLRYFYENQNHIHVIAAGSLLESVLENQISFPVGRVEYLMLRPFSFEEYLLANKEGPVYELYHTVPIPDYAHSVLSDLFKEYCLIGGMPEAVAKYVESKSIEAVANIYENLIVVYMDDIEKYAKTDRQINILRHIIKNAFAYAGSRIKFEGFANSSYKSRDIVEGFRLLEKTFILALSYPITTTGLPFVENIKKAPKLHLLDTGLVNKFAGLQISILNTKHIDGVYEGRIAEHIVGQEILSVYSSVTSKNRFWTKEKNQSSAEIDFIIQFDELLIPVEVKAGKTGKLRSLFEFIDLAPHPYAIRVYSGLLTIETHKTIKGKAFYLLNLPFYLVGKIYDYAGHLVHHQSL